MRKQNKNGSLEKLKNLLILAILAVFFFSSGKVKAQCSSIDFTSSITQGCAPAVVKFDASNIPSGSNIIWDFGSGPVNGSDTISRIFTQAGMYDISLTVTLPNGNTCSAIQKDDLIEILQSPDPVIGVDTQIYCSGVDTVLFVDKTPNSQSRNWIIDGNSFVNANDSIEFPFTTTGDKDVTLQVTSSNGCKGISSNPGFIKIRNPLNLLFCANITENTSGVTANYRPSSSSSNRISSYDWAFEGGTPANSTNKNVSVNYSDKKDYKTIIEVTTQDGCVYKYERDSFIFEVAETDKIQACIGESIEITEKATGYGFQDIQTLAPGAEVEPNAPNILKYSSAGNKSFIIAFKDKKSGCVNTFNYSNELEILGPKADISLASILGCNAPDTVEFESNSTLPSGGKVQYTWTIADTNGNQLTGSPIGPRSSDTMSFIFKKNDFYDINLTVGHTNGCNNTATQRININSPNPDFEVDETDLCRDEVFKIFNLTTPEDSEDNPYNYEWEVAHADSPGVNTTATAKNPNIGGLDVPGNYDVKLVVRTSQACADSLVKEDYITIRGSSGRIELDKQVGCTPLTTKATGIIDYSFPSSARTEFNWAVVGPDPNSDNFIDIKDQTTLEPTFTFSKTGVYVVYLNIFTIIGNDTCLTQLQSPVEVGIAAALNTQSTAYDPVSGRKYCPGEPIWFFDSTAFAGGSAPDTRKWLFDKNAGVSISPHDSALRPDFFFPDAGNYKISLAIEKKVSPTETCYDTVSETVSLGKPEAGFESNDTISFCAPAIVDFKSTSVKGVAQLDSFLWKFGDGTSFPTVNPNPSYAYQTNNPGGFDVSLIAIDRSGCRDTFFRDDYIRIIGPVPEFTIDKNSGCDTLTVKFTDNSINVETFLFDYGDGTPLDTNDIGYHQYNNTVNMADSVVYTPVMLASDDLNCQAFKEDTVVIYNTPTPDFTADTTTGCAPFLVNFQDQSMNAIGWNWDLDGDGTNDSTGEVTSYLYQSDGYYDVTLSLDGSGNCNNSVTIDSFINVIPKPNGNLQLSDNRACDSLTVFFSTQLSGNDIENYVIHYGDGSKDSNQLNPHFYEFDYSNVSSEEEVFEITFVSWNSLGCPDTLKQNIRIFRKPEPQFELVNGTGCDNQLVEFRDTSEFSTVARWDLDEDGNFELTGDTVDKFYSTGFYDVSLQVESQFGCTSQISEDTLVKIYNSPSAEFKVDKKDYCLADSIITEDLSTGNQAIVRWEWKLIRESDNAITDSSDRQSPKLSPANSQGGDHQLQLVITDLKGCSDTVTKTIKVIESTQPSDSKIAGVTVEENDRLVINWSRNTVSPFEGYLLYRNGKDPSQRIYHSEDPRDTFYIESKPEVNPDENPTCYYLQAIDRCGNIVQLGSVHCAMYLDVFQRSELSNTLSWTAYKGWNEDLGGYRVFRSTDGINYKQIAERPSNATFHIDTPVCDSTYFYYIQAFNKATQNTVKSNSDSVQTQYVRETEALNLNYASVIDDKNIEVSWETTSLKNLDAYEIYRQSRDSNQLSLIGETRETEFTDKEIQPDKTYYSYFIRSRDKCGYINEFSNPARSILFKASTQEETDYIETHWTPYIEWKEGVAEYIVQVQDEEASFRDLSTINSQDTSFTDENLYDYADSTFCYRVLAIENSDPADTSISNEDCTLLPSRIFVPNAFSPNNDGLNDEFKISYLSLRSLTGNPFTEFRLIIFNKWGQVVFETNDPNEGWDGTFRGKELSADHYNYWLKATGFDSEEYFRKGSLTIIR